MFSNLFIAYRMNKLTGCKMHLYSYTIKCSRYSFTLWKDRYMVDNIQVSVEFSISTYSFTTDTAPHYFQHHSAAQAKAVLNSRHSAITWYSLTQSAYLVNSSFCSSVIALNLTVFIRQLRVFITNWEAIKICL